MSVAEPFLPESDIRADSYGYVRMGRAETTLTNWTFEPNLRLHYPDGSIGERGILTVGSCERHPLEISALAWNSRKDILSVVGKYGGVCFTNTNKDIASIRNFIMTFYRDLPRAQGVKSYGLFRFEGEWLELYENETRHKGKHPPLFYAGTPVDPGSDAYRAPRIMEREKVNAAREGIGTLADLITPAAALAMLGYAAASAFSPRITSYLGDRLPFLNIAGERESGKTSFAKLALEAVGGYGAREHKAIGITPYQYDLAFSNMNNALTLLDEYRPGEVAEAQLRKHHDLGVKWRGSGIASKDFGYFLNAPMIVLGEGFVEDAAALNRGVLYFVSKEDRSPLEIYVGVQRLPLHAYAAYLHERAREDAEEAHSARFALSEKAAKEATQGYGSPRLQHALTFIAYGLHFLQADVSGKVFSPEAILDCLRVGVINTLDGGMESVTNLEQFLEQLGAALSNHRDVRSVIVPAVNTDELIIRVSNAVETVKKFYGRQASISNARLLKKFTDNASYFHPGDTHRSVQNSPIRGARLKLAEVPKRCDVSVLEHYNERLRNA